MARIVRGTAGHDVLSFAKHGKEDLVVYAGEGWDVITGSPERDWILGEGGDDQLTGGAGDDWLYGQAGNDRLLGDSGDDHLFGGAGTDRIWGGADNDTIYGGDSYTLSGGAGPGYDYIWGDGGNDKIYASGELHGGSGDDLIWGGIGRDRIYGDADADLLIGSLGADYIYGGAGNDTLIAGRPHAAILAPDLSFNIEDARFCRFQFLASDDSVNHLFGESGDDLLLGGVDTDFLHGGDDADEIHGGDGDDFLYGDRGNDELLGLRGVDTLSGGEGNDVLWGEEDNDVLSGGAGADLLMGGVGADELTGGAGRDGFVYFGAGFFGAGDHLFTDRIIDFTLRTSGASGSGGDPLSPGAIGLPSDTFAPDYLDMMDVLINETSFDWGTMGRDGAFDNGYVYWEQYGTPGAGDFGTRVYVDPDGGAHNAATDYAMVDLVGIAAADFHRDYILV